jgi:hypothetical protein
LALSQDPAAHRNCAIKSAAQNGHASVVELLLADPRLGGIQQQQHYKE